jgi:hypothetical protein
MAGKALSGEFVLRDIKTPFEGARVRMNTWWHMKDGKGVFYRRLPKDRHLYPQCNMQEAVVRKIGEKEPWKDFDVEFVEVSYMPQED